MQQIWKQQISCLAVAYNFAVLGLVQHTKVFLLNWRCSSKKVFFFFHLALLFNVFFVIVDIIV